MNRLSTGASGRILNQGEADCYEGLPYRNPYPIDTKEAREYEEGYKAAALVRAQWEDLCQDHWDAA